MESATETLLAFGGAGHEHWSSPDYYYDARKRIDREHVALQLTLAGSAFYHPVGGARQTLGAGKVFLDVIPGPFEYGWDSGKLELVFVCIQGAEAKRLMSQMHALHGPVFDLGGSSAVAETMLDFAREARSPSSPARSDAFVMSGRLYGLLMQVLSELSRTRMEASALVARAMTLVEGRASDPAFNVTRLAKELDCSREHLAREFRDALKVSPVAYLTQERVRRAARELRSSAHEKLERVARESGFGSAQYFCRVFRRATGVTPGQFREREWLVVG